MMRLKAVGFAAGLLLGLAGMVWHSDVLVWAGVVALGGVFVLRFVRREAPPLR